MPPTTIMAGVLVTLAFFALVGYVVRTMVRSEVGTIRLTATLTAIGALVAALPAVLYALYGA